MITLVRCDLCPDPEFAWEQDDPTGTKLRAHKERQHAETTGVVTNEAVADLLYGDPKNDRGKSVIEECIREDAERHNGHVDQNRVRELIPAWVNPRLVGSVYSVLIRRGVLLPDGETRSTDKRGRNAGKRFSTYIYRGAP